MPRNPGGALTLSRETIKEEKARTDPNVVHAAMVPVGLGLTRVHALPLYPAMHAPHEAAATRGLGFALVLAMDKETVGEVDEKLV